MQTKRSLPIDVVLPELQRVLRAAPAAVVQAPPGAGKTTRVPLALLGQEWASGRIVMLEPRRLAARAAARYMAAQLGEQVGQTVGYRVRQDTRVSARTRVEVVTEGVLTRMLHGDPALEGVSAVIFDEFHERSLHADLGLALTLQAQAMLRPDLRIIVMSATLDGERVAALLDDAPVVTSSGKLFPVDTQYLARPVEGRIEDAVVASVRRALQEEPGDTLVFLPGAAEIERVRAALAESAADPAVDIYPLYGQLPNEQQDRAIAPSPAGRRKVVLATSIAETSLTIEGVRVVIDAGLARAPRFSPRTGMTRLETARVTRASADQRRGRAGRTQEGVCYRLWTEAEQSALLAFGQPEIMQADLAPLALDLARWGAQPNELKWLDAPPAAAYAQARELLRELGALDAAGALTVHGRELSELAIHPRLAHMLLRARALDLLGTAADLAALLDERDLLRDTPDPDVRLRLHALRSQRGDRATLQRVRAQARALLDTVSGRPGYEDDAAGLLLAFAYPDRIGQARGARGRFLLRNGRGATIEKSAPMAASDYVVVAQVDDRGADGRAFLAAPISKGEIETHFAEQFEVTREVEWRAGNARGTERVQLGALVLTERAFTPDAQEAGAAFARTIERDGLDSLRWSEAALALRQRLRFLHAHDASWPAVDDRALLAALADADPAQLDLAQLLLGRLSWQQRAKLDELAPTHLTVPSGSRLPIDYADPDSPVLAARLQELFGWTETPRIAGGRVPLTVHLLSPAQRPVQVTRDLASFWRSGYFDVKKDLKGRYPKHYWPDDPLSATATRRVRPRPGEEQ